MNAYDEAPVPMFDTEGPSSMPPGGGLGLVIAGSFIFWAVLLWAVL